MFLFTNGGIEVRTHTGPSVLASCVCTSRLNQGVIYHIFKRTVFVITKQERGIQVDRTRRPPDLETHSICVRDT